MAACSNEINTEPSCNVMNSLEFSDDMLRRKVGYIRFDTPLHLNNLLKMAQCQRKI